MTVLTAVSPVTLNDASRGLAQQMVFWGQDVMHPAGNALVSFGLRRAESTGLKGTSCYSMPWQGGTTELHGAVASWSREGGEGGVLFSREQGRILLWNEGRPPVPGRESGVSGTPTERWEAFRPLLDWLIAYETWVVETLGEGWRESGWRTLKALPKGKPWLPPKTALEWWKLARDGEAPRPKRMAVR